MMNGDLCKVTHFNCYGLTKNKFRFVGYINKSNRLNRKEQQQTDEQCTVFVYDHQVTAMIKCLQKK